MADEETKVELKPGEVAVPEKVLSDILKRQSEMEIEREKDKSRMEGLEALVRENAGAETTGEKKLRNRKEFTPAFRTVTIKRMPMGADPEKEGYVIGYTNRGAYQRVDASGISKTLVDFIDVIFLDHEKTEDGKKLLAESVPLLTLMNSPEIECKVIEVKDYEGKPMKLRYSPLIDPDLSLDRQGEQRTYTGEMIKVTSFDPKHGLVTTGEEIEGWVARTDMTFVIQIPGRLEPVEIDSKFCNI